MKNSITFIGHSTFLINLNKTKILTDPIFSNRIKIIKRINPPGFKISELPKIDLILISHGHYDHFDIPSLKNFPRYIPIIVPKGIILILKRLGFENVNVMEPWQEIFIGKTKITAVPAKHFKGRSPIHPFIKYQGYVIENKKTVYFSGDTGFFESFKEIGNKFKIDIVILPIGAYKPDSFRENHMSPEDALDAFKILKAKKLIPCHWGAFKLSDEPIDEPPKRLLTFAKRKKIKNVFLLNPRQKIIF